MTERTTFDWSVLNPGRNASERADGSVLGGAMAPVGLASDGPAPDLWAAGDEPKSGVGLPLRVNDLKQYAYCPRVVFYHYAMPVQHRATFKMDHGKAVEVKIERLERRRKLRAYGLGEGTRRFQVGLASRRLGLSGRLDVMIQTPSGIFPVDFKDTLSRIHHNHHLQLCAYALLIEDEFRQPVTHGFVYRVPRDDIAVVEMTPELRVETVGTMQAIRTMVAAERMPEPTAVRRRCDDCEYRNYCGDVF